MSTFTGLPPLPEVNIVRPVDKDEEDSHVVSDVSEYPPGLQYVENFLSPEEQAYAIKLIDAHAYTQKIHRRQQFYGQVYYHTPQSPRSTLQPVDKSLATKVMGQSTVAAELEEEEVPCHELSPLQWVIDKLIDEGLFIRADNEDPMVEYIRDKDTGRLQAIPREDGPGKVVQWKQAEGQLAQFQSFPDQILVNEYTVKQNIGTHYDDALAFGPLIVGVSLADDCVISLTVPHCLGKADAELRQKLEADNIADIEDMGKRENLKFPLKGPSNELLSYLVSIRDFSDNSWNEGQAPEITGKHCKCSREAYLLEHEPHKKTFLFTGREHTTNELRKNAYKEKKVLFQRLRKEREEAIARGEEVLTMENLELEIDEYLQKKIDLLSHDAKDRETIDDYIFNYDYPANTNLLPTLANVNSCPHIYKQVDVKLKPGSVYILSGASRYLYRHGIRKFNREEMISQPDYRRLSMTVRSLYPGRRQVLQGSEVDQSTRNLYKNEKPQ